MVRPYHLYYRQNFHFHDQRRDNRIVSAEIVIGTNENETYTREDCKLSGWPELVIKKSANGEISANGENVPVSAEPDESKTLPAGEGSAGSGLGDSGFKSEGIRDPQTDCIILLRTS